MEIKAIHTFWKVNIYRQYTHKTFMNQNQCLYGLHHVYIYIYTYHRVITINLKDILGYLAPLLCGGCHVFLTGVEAAEPRPVWMDGCCSELTYATVGKPIGYLDVVS